MSAELMRYFRVRSHRAPSQDAGEVLVWLREHFGGAFASTINAVLWIPSSYLVFSVSKLAFLHESPLYVAGSIVGMDASSVATVVALDCRPDDTVLDMCCCPGMKWLLVGERLTGGLVVGVDCSMPRLFVARSLARKLDAFSSSSSCSNGVLAFADGRAFCPARLEAELLEFRSPFQRRKRLQQLAEERVSTQVETALVFPEFKNRKRTQSGHDRAETIHIPRQFKRVLVDVECTHDGSVNHLVHEDTTAVAGTFQERLALYKPHYALHGEESGELLTLQLALLERGYELLAASGTLIYSTCSLSPKQNEDIVRRFLERHAADAADCRPQLLHPFNDVAMSDDTRTALQGIAVCVDDRFPALRFYPEKTLGSFQFIAKIKKGID